MMHRYVLVVLETSPFQVRLLFITPLFHHIGTDHDYKSSSVPKVVCDAQGMDRAMSNSKHIRTAFAHYINCIREPKF